MSYKNMTVNPFECGGYRMLPCVSRSTQDTGTLCKVYSWCHCSVSVTLFGVLLFTLNPFIPMKVREGGLPVGRVFSVRKLIKGISQVKCWKGHLRMVMSISQSDASKME